MKSTVLLFAIRTVVHIFCCREMRVTHGIALNPKVEKGQDTNRRKKNNNCNGETPFYLSIVRYKKRFPTYFYNDLLLCAKVYVTN